jgi:nicotinate-nucleotide adenylyltransferase
MGGAFNPVHLGHLRAAEEIASKWHLGKVLFMPSALSPHKGGEEMASFQDRFEMVKLAVRGRDGFEASDLEARLSTPSYTINTLRALHAGLEGSGELFFLVGFDSFRSIGQWKRYKDLFQLASFVVNIRPEAPGSRRLLGSVLEGCLGERPHWSSHEEAYLPSGLKPVYYFESSRLAISSTDLRQRLRDGESIRYLVPDPVLDYLLGHGLYTRAADQPDQPDQPGQGRP